MDTAARGGYAPPMMRLGIGIAVTLLLVALAGAAWLVMRPRGPSAGVELVYACPEAVAAHDVEVVQRRLDDIGASAAAEATDAQHLRLRVGSDASSIELARSVVSAHTLELAAVDEVAMRAAGALPPGVRVEGAAPTFVAASASMLATISVPSGARVVTQCAPGTPCRGWIVGASELGDAEVTDARAVGDDTGAGIAVTFDAHGRDRLAALTSRAVGHRIAILLDGRALMVPVVQESVTGGSVRIALGSDGSVAEADAIARALRGGHLACSSWSLERQAAFGR